MCALSVCFIACNTQHYMCVTLTSPGCMDGSVLKHRHVDSTQKIIFNKRTKYYKLSSSFLLPLYFFQRFFFLSLLSCFSHPSNLIFFLFCILSLLYLHIRCTLRYNFSILHSFFGFHQPLSENIHTNVSFKYFCVYTPTICVYTPVNCVYTPAICVYTPVICVYTPAICVCIPVSCVYTPAICVYTP